MGALPKLLPNPTGKSFSCPTPRPCKTCLYQNVCVGCQAAPSCYRQEMCHRDCGDCGGGQYQNQGTYLCPAICGRSPIKDLYAGAVKRDGFVFTPRPQIEFGNKAIIMHHGLFGGSDTDLFIDGLGAVAVNLKKVWTPRGWYSRDIRDYLRIPSHIKLILLSCTYDDVLEKAWATDVQYTDFASLGFDYWEIYELSQYHGYSKCFNLWMGYRGLVAGEASRAHFAQVMPWVISLHRDPSAYQPWIDWTNAVPQITVNWQFTSATNPKMWRWCVATILKMLKVTPGVKGIWFQGVSAPNEVYNLTKAFKEYDCYFISSNPWMCAHHRKRATPDGKMYRSTRDRLDLLLQNQTDYVNLVKDAVSSARGSRRGVRKAQVKV